MWQVKREEGEEQRGFKGRPRNLAKEITQRKRHLGCRKWKAQPKGKSVTEKKVTAKREGAGCSVHNPISQVREKTAPKVVIREKEAYSHRLPRAQSKKGGTGRNQGGKNTGTSPVKRSRR